MRKGWPQVRSGQVREKHADAVDEDEDERFLPPPDAAGTLYVALDDLATELCNALVIDSATATNPSSAEGAPHQPVLLHHGRLRGLHRAGHIG
jgi:hypothetical protein